jgi:hypothetical protein
MAVTMTTETTPKPLPSPIPYHTYYGQSLPEPAIYDYVTDQAGVVMRVRTPHFYAVHRCAFGHVRGLGRWPEEAEAATPGTQAGVLLSVPKIPASWLTRVLGHALKASGSVAKMTLRALTALRPIEAMYHFHYLPQQADGAPGCGWQVRIPKQVAKADLVDYWGGNEATVALDLHSHHEMPAFFSQDKDDKDELGARFYAVIGRIYSRPEIRLRLGLYGKWVNLPATTLFEGLGPFVDVCQGEADQVDRWSDEELERLARGENPLTIRS